MVADNRILTAALTVLQHGRAVHGYPDRCNASASSHSRALPDDSSTGGLEAYKLCYPSINGIVKPFAAINALKVRVPTCTIRCTTTCSW